MLIRSFRTIQPINVLLLLIITLLLKIIPLCGTGAQLNDVYNEPLSRLLFEDLGLRSLGHVPNVLLTSFIVFIQALILNQIVSRYTVFFKSSYLPALMYVVIMSSIGVFAELNPQLICNFLLLIILNKIFALYKSQRAMAITFDLGVLFALCSLLYFPYILLTLLTWISLLFFRPFVWREWLCGLIGLFVSYFLLFVYYFWNVNLEEFFHIFAPLNQIQGFDVYLANNDLYGMLPMLVAFCFSANKLRQNFFRNIIQVRKIYQLTFIFILLSILSFYIPGYAHPTHFIMLSIPVAIYLSYYFLVAKRAWIAELMAYTIILSIIIFQAF